MRPGYLKSRTMASVAAALTAVVATVALSAVPSSALSSRPASIEHGRTASTNSGGWKPSPSCKTSNPVVQQAIKFTEQDTVPNSNWYATPKSIVKLKPHQKIVFIPTDATNELSYTWGKDILAIAKKIGWKATMIDGKGTTAGWDAALTEALALKPNAILYSANAPSLISYNKEAKKLGIPIIGLHGTAYAGPAPADYEYTNVTTQPNEIGLAEADYAIAASCGTARVIVEYDSTYAVATAKAMAQVAEIKKCKTCKLLAVVNSPLAELTTLEPGLCTSWVSKYGTGWYALSIYDGVWDYCVPSLKAAGVSPTAVHLIGSDGTSTAYTRMRSHDYQVASVPEPAQLQAYIAINEANRAILGLSPSYGSGKGQWVQPVYLAYDEAPFGSNLGVAGGGSDQYFPPSGYAAKYLSGWGVSS